MSETEKDQEFLGRIWQRLKKEKNAPYSGYVHFEKEDLKRICDLTLPIIAEDPSLLVLQPPLLVYGDIHGQFSGLMAFLEKYGLPPESQLLFLGDYVDRGPNSVEVLVTLFVLKCMYPKNIWLLRGNHETRETTQMYGFAEECRIRYSSEIYNWFNDVFGYLPLAATIGGRIFCVHGGISSELERLSQISNIERPIDIYDGDLVQDLLWSDPSPIIRGYQKSSRGTSYTYGVDAVDEFLDKFDFDLICRSHQAVSDGFDFPFLPSRTVVTIFSATNYFQDQPNRPAIMSINEMLACSFKFLDPAKPSTKPKII